MTTPPGLFDKTNRTFKQYDDAVINNPIENVISIPSAAHDSLVVQTFPLVRHGLRLHANRSGEIGSANLILPRDLMEKSQTSVIRENVKQCADR